MYLFVHPTNIFLSFSYVPGTSLSAVDMTENKTETISRLCSLYTFLKEGRQTIREINKLNLQLLEDSLREKIRLRDIGDSGGLQF